MKKGMGWVFPKHWQRRVALKKRLIARAIDTLVDRQIEKLSHVSDANPRHNRDHYDHQWEIKVR